MLDKWSGEISKIEGTSRLQVEGVANGPWDNYKKLGNLVTGTQIVADFVEVDVRTKRFGDSVIAAGSIEPFLPGITLLGASVPIVEL